jgi:hypothetical protein
MAVYDCQCGMIISTSSDRPQCLRCHRELGLAEAAEGMAPRAAAPESPPVTVYAIHFSHITLPYGLHHRPALWSTQDGSAI